MVPAARSPHDPLEQKRSASRSVAHRILVVQQVPDRRESPAVRRLRSAPQRWMAPVWRLCVWPHFVTMVTMSKDAWGLDPASLLRDPHGPAGVYPFWS